MCDASSHGVGSVIVGKNKACVPTVFHWEWPQEVKDLFHEGHISNSNLEMAGLLLLWLVMESVCGNLRERRVALFSDYSPTVGWVLGCTLLFVLLLRLDLDQHSNLRIYYA